jgi:hypothetical protein
MPHMCHSREKLNDDYHLVVAALIYIGFALIGNASLPWIATEVSGVGI